MSISVAGFSNGSPHSADSIIAPRMLRRPQAGEQDRPGLSQVHQRCRLASIAHCVAHAPRLAPPSRIGMVVISAGSPSIWRAAADPLPVAP